MGSSPVVVNIFDSSSESDDQTSYILYEYIIIQVESSLSNETVLEPSFLSAQKFRSAKSVRERPSFLYLDILFSNEHKRYLRFHSLSFEIFLN